VCFCMCLRLQSRHHWLLTVAAEGVVRLLYPLKYQHVYIPVMPSSLADYLEVSRPTQKQTAPHLPHQQLAADAVHQDCSWQSSC
jgi:hypothetical protein